MKRMLAEVGFDVGTGPSPNPSAKGEGRKRSVTVNLAESPLGWLRARGLVDARQFEAGERLRADYETASLGQRVTMRWDAAPASGGRRGPPRAVDATVGQISAKRRFDAAIAALGGGLSDIAWRVICAGEGLPVAEEGLGWPKRSGRVVLTLALDRLADHYGLG
ncbi:DUF6456 domain-containing protein [Sphingomonas gilva]|uniref:DUF6456 domain-containing protein n=1 Tax=Sphingomonas gilva TaxID=2305907 RepID=UPI001FE3DEA4|nr:DUF6456 domain-containing protein [Sphingomonas gilva]